MNDLIDTLQLFRGAPFSAGPADFTAIDVETTGLHPGHIVELAAVRTRADGTLVSELSTLVNPGHGIDPGPVNIHRITRRQLDGAPSFAEVLGDFADICRGSVLVAHNLSFEKRFLEGEISRLRLSMPVLPGVCTVSATKVALTLPNYRLATIAGALGLGDYAAHTALADARICSKLISSLVTTHQLGFARRPVLAELPRWQSTRSLLPRPGDRTAVAGGWMAGLLDRMQLETPGATDKALEDAYVDLLADALSDQHISPEETRALTAMAATAGLAERDVRRIHEVFVRSMRRVAESDGAITSAEERELRQVATALRVPDLVRDLRVTETVVVTGRAEGMRVLVLGASPAADELRASLLSVGVRLAKNLTASVTHLVVGAEVVETEPRLGRARELGVAVVPMAEAAARLGLSARPTPQRPIPEPRPVVLESAVTFPPVAAAPPMWEPVRQTVPVPVPARPRKELVWIGRGVMAVGLFLMFLTVISMFGGLSVGGGLFFGLFGLSGLLGGWALVDRNSPHPASGVPQ
ncbi:exonuclease domain-containing protein [Amycolatopsis sp. cg5]|uniref:exonuclease domain-containing protein n=1 Tax=Amycolatopsis sp. cg5 TaxID=3238802 RepID=UPI00352424A8